MMFDFAVIEAHVARTRPDLELGAETLGNYLGLSRRTVLTLRKRGMSHVVADRVCIRGLGVHPAFIFPDWGREPERMVAA